MKTSEFSLKAEDRTAYISQTIFSKSDVHWILSSFYECFQLPERTRLVRKLVQLGSSETFAPEQPHHWPLETGTCYTHNRQYQAMPS